MIALSWSSETKTKEETVDDPSVDALQLIDGKGMNQLLEK